MKWANLLKGKLADWFSTNRNQNVGPGLFLVRHGDVLVSEIGEIPEGAVKRSHLVLAEGEFTGHSHRIAEPQGAKLFQLQDQMYLEVISDQVTLVHQEHGPIKLPRGCYRAWRQREYSPKEIRVIRD